MCTGLPIWGQTMLTILSFLIFAVLSRGLAKINWEKLGLMMSLTILPLLLAIYLKVKRKPKPELSKIETPKQKD